MNRLVKGLLVISLLALWAGIGNGQVVADFEDGTTSGFGVGWGSGITLSNAADPAGTTIGALQVDLDAPNGFGAASMNNVDAAGSEIGTIFIYLPTGVPDSVLMKVYAQDQDGWTWTDEKYYAVDIPKDVWYPLHLNFVLKNMANSGFDVNEGDLNRFGIEFASGELAAADAAWTGMVYIDNVSVVGAQPGVVADFEDETTQGYGIGWGSGITLATIADPGGVSVTSLDVQLDAANGFGAMSKNNVDATNGYVGVYYVYLPTGVPDSVLMKVYAQDQDGWTWTDEKYYAVDIPKDTWYPIYLDFIKKHIANAGFDVNEGVLNRFGIEFSSGELPAADATWTGSVYVDNIAVLGTVTGEKWVKAAFENELAGTQGFSNNGWGPCLTDVSWLADPTTESAGVLNTVWDFNAGPSYKGSFAHSNISIYDDGTATYANKITIDIFPPVDIPLGAAVAIFTQDHDTWTFNKDTAAIDDANLIRGQWNTVEYMVEPHVTAGEIDPTATLTVGVEILYADAQTWTGNVYWDNFTLWGLAAPEGDILSPTVVATIDTSTTSVPSYQYVNIAWIDNTVGTETYHVYMSTAPIADVTDIGVIRLTNDVPHGVEAWNHRPFTNDGSDGTYYYAVTAKAPDGTETALTDACKAGPVMLPTSPTAKAVYDADFASKFTLDGLDTEFVEYAAFKLQPENANGDDSAGWTVDSDDLSWNTTFVIDDDYLYVSADVTDDDLNSDGTAPIIEGTQPWKGDALEFYIGYYDVNLLDDYHNYRDVDAAGTGDHRIAFTAWGTTGTATSNDQTFPGVETTVYEKFGGDGYIMEARIALDSLALDGDINVQLGTMMPLSINCNDMDPGNSDETRTLQANWGGSSNDEGWLRPGSWGFMEVIDPTTDVADGTAAVPKRFHLSESYPNPFNPSTTLAYELAKYSEVKIVVYDMLGKQIKTLINGSKAAGAYTAKWDGTNDAGLRVASGLYFCKMITPDYSRTVKMTLIK